MSKIAGELNTEMMKACAATNPQELERQIMSSSVPKNERKHWAVREIEYLRNRFENERATVVAYQKVIQQADEDIKDLREQLSASQKREVTLRKLIGEIYCSDDSSAEVTRKIEDVLSAMGNSYSKESTQGFEDWHKEHAKYMEPVDIVHWCRDSYGAGRVDGQDDAESLRQKLDTAWAQAHRLALELECLLLDTKDNAVVSKWWDSGMEALSEYQELKPGAKEDAEAWGSIRKGPI